MSALTQFASGLARQFRLQQWQYTAARQLASAGGGDGSSSSSDSSDSDNDAGAATSDDESSDRWDSAWAKGPDGRAPAYEHATPTADGALYMSQALAALVEQVQGMSADQLLEETTRGEAATGPAPSSSRAAAAARQGGGRGRERVSKEDYLLLAEAINLYFQAAPVCDEALDGMGEGDREMLAAVGGVIREELGGTAADPTDVGGPAVVNIAPPGRLPWEVLEVDEENAVVHWGVDLTEGRAPDPWRNGLLSGEAKAAMASLHARDPRRYSVECLAGLFRVRQQRVMAVLALQEMEAKARAESEAKAAAAAAAAAAAQPLPAAAAAAAGESQGPTAASAAAEGEGGAAAAEASLEVEEAEKAEAEAPPPLEGLQGLAAEDAAPAPAPYALHDELAELMEEEVHAAVEASGSGERHYTILPSYPQYRELDPAAAVSRLTAKLGRKMSAITEDDLTPGLAREVLGVPEDTAQAEERLAAAEEASLVEEFRRSLRFNMGTDGAGISRTSRKSATPRRPKAGWGLLVKTLGEGGGGAYVAQRDGSRRELTPDEALNLERQKPRPRRKVQ